MRSLANVTTVPVYGFRMQRRAFSNFVGFRGALAALPLFHHVYSGASVSLRIPEATFEMGTFLARNIGYDAGAVQRVIWARR